MSSKLFSLLVGLTLTTSTLSGAELRAIVPEKHLDLMFDYCMDCHNADTQKGKVNLEDLPLEVDTLQHAELWQKVLDVLNSGEMPPENKRQPEKVAKADFLEDLGQDHGSWPGKNFPIPEGRLRCVVLIGGSTKIL